MEYALTILFILNFSVDYFPFQRKVTLSFEDSTFFSVFVSGSHDGKTIGALKTEGENGESW